MPPNGIHTLSDEGIFRYGDPDECRKELEALQWKLGFLNQLIDGKGRFISERPLKSHTLLRCDAFKKLASEDGSYRAEVQKLGVTAVQLLAISSTAKQLRADPPKFKADYVKHFLLRDPKISERSDIEQRLQGKRGAGGGFPYTYAAIKSGKHEPFDE
jgi:hypothetical protein